MHNVRGNRSKPMAVDRPADHDPEEVSGSLREKQHEVDRQPVDGMPAGRE
jgi:hypothetical protein